MDLREVVAEAIHNAWCVTSYVDATDAERAEALRHIAEAALARGGNDDAVAVATRCRLNVAKASAYLDGEVPVPPRDVKG